MPRKFMIYFPLVPQVGDEICAAVEYLLCDSFGGVTSYPARGVFRMEDGHRAAENIQVLEAYCEAEDWPAKRPFILALAKVLRMLLKQETIAIAVDGRLQMVNSGRKCDFPPFEGMSLDEREASLKSLIAQSLSAEE